MHGTNVHSTIIPDVLTIIALCTGARSTTELALALNAIATGKTWFPSGPENVEMNGRIALRLLYAPWKSAAQAALIDPYAVYLAEHFRRACIACVPTSAPSDPLSDPNWFTGVQELYARERSMQMIADALVNYLEQHVGRLIGFSPDPQPLPVAAPGPTAPPPAKPATLSPSAPAPSPEEIRAKLIARIELLAKAKRFADEFMRYYNAQKAREAAAHATQSAPTIAAPEPLEPSAAPPIATATPKVEAASSPEARRTTTPTIVIPTRTPTGSDVVRVAVPRALYMHIPARNRVVCRPDRLPTSVHTSSPNSPPERDPTSAPFRQATAQMRSLDAQSPPYQQSLSPPA